MRKIERPNMSVASIAERMALHVLKCPSGEHEEALRASRLAVGSRNSLPEPTPRETYR